MLAALFVLSVVTILLWAVGRPARRLLTALGEESTFILNVTKPTTAALERIAKGQLPKFRGFFFAMTVTSTDVEVWSDRSNPVRVISIPLSAVTTLTVAQIKESGYPIPVVVAEVLPTPHGATVSLPLAFAIKRLGSYGPPSAQKMGLIRDRFARAVGVSP